MLFSRGSKSTVGLDIGANSVKMVRLTQSKNGYVVNSMAIRELPPEAIVTDEIRDREAVIFSIQSVMDECDIVTKDVVVSLSGHALITDKLVIDKKSGAEAEQAILFEAEQRSPFDVEDVALDHHVIRLNEDTNKMEILLVAARKEFLQAYLSLIIDCGLNPVIVDTDAFAVYNAYVNNYEVDPNRVTALVNMGQDVTNVLYLKDGIYHSTRDVAVGTRGIFNSIQQEFRLNHELTNKTLQGEMEGSIDQDMLKATIVSATEEIINGLELAFNYFKSQANIDIIDWMVLSGGGALIPFLPEYLQSKMQIPLEIFNPLRNIEYDPERLEGLQPEKIAPLLTVPIGMAMRKVG
ncbi:MAG: type IV pilus assembly protein PilM [candidate division Zixibacteria bacterium]|nr:type IV pilus assembly protein PilM [candidate division Zixibacteria bacterium]